MAEDFDLDGTADLLNSGLPLPCCGDPLPDHPDVVTDGDWLVNADDDDTDGVQCTGLLIHRSSEYDWLRYFWGMWTVEDVDLEQLWGLWDAAHTHSWNGGATGVAGDFPNARMEAAAAAKFSTEHANQAVHGLDH